MLFREGHKKSVDWRGVLGGWPRSKERTILSKGRCSGGKLVRTKKGRGDPRTYCLWFSFVENISQVSVVCRPFFSGGVGSSRSVKGPAREKKTGEKSIKAPGGGGRSLCLLFKKKHLKKRNAPDKLIWSTRENFDFKSKAPQKKKKKKILKPPTLNEIPNA